MFFIILLVIVAIIVYVILEKKSVNNHMKNVNYVPKDKQDNIDNKDDAD